MSQADASARRNHDDGTTTSADGTSLAWTSWCSDTAPPTAVVVLAHGGLEHAGRYGYMGSRLADAGFATYAGDFRGHGRSGGRPGQIGRMARLVEDLEAVRSVAEQRHPGVPVFLLGHSLGAMVALEYLLGPHPSVAGVVLSGTGIDVSAVPAAQVRVLRLLSAVAPNLGLVTFDGEGVSQDPEVVAAYRNDPLVFHGKVPSRTPAELFASAARIIPRLAEINDPVLVVHGGADTVAQPDGARLVHEQISSVDKQLMIYDGSYHEVFNEPDRDVTIGDVVAWLIERA